GDDRRDALTPRSQNIKPQQNRPKSVLFTHMVGSSSCTLLAADRCQPRVEQIAEKLPSGRRLVKRYAKPCGDTIGGPARRHGARNSGDALVIAGREMGVRGQDRETVGGRDEPAPPDDQIAITVAVRRCAEIGTAGRHSKVE